MDSNFSPLPTEENAQQSGSSKEFSPTETRRIWKNVLVLGFAFMIHFTAFWGASNLQSSINADDSLGTFTLASIYGSLLLSNIFLPVIVIKWLGCKWTTALALIAYMPFILAQFYPRFYTMIPAGLAVGLGGGPLWCAKCTYLTVVAEAYSGITGVASDVIVTRFFGVFFMFYQFSQVWGNLISSAVLSSGTSGEIFNETLSLSESLISSSSLSNFTFMNSALNNSTESILFENFCGANFDASKLKSVGINPDDAPNPNLSAPSTGKINIIAGIYLACMIAACLIVIFFVDSLSRYNKGRASSGTGLSGCKMLALTMKQLGNRNQILILPITMFIGAEQAFLAADFTSAFVACGWGISNIGYVMICFGVSNAISALCSGSIVKVTGRSPVVAFAFILHLILRAVLLLWRPSTYNTLIYFFVACAWGLADAIWLVQINSLYGILFPGKEEASYSNFRLWESTGSVITYACSPFLSTRIKILLLALLLIVGVLGFATVQVLESRRQRKDAMNGKQMKVLASSTND